MALLDLWQNNRSQLAQMQVKQVIAVAGDGHLRDGMPASAEFREFLRHVPSELLAKYADECLKESFQDSGLALQDVVNEIGRRLDFNVVHGRYRGTCNQPGHDGLWSDATKHSIVVEVKTTDAYRVDLNSIAKYRQTLSDSGDLRLDASSMLVVVGRHDTGDLEAQIRGSRHAWDMRVISVDGLLRMLKLKEEVEEPTLIKRIHDILIPHEFTRLDPIIEIAFDVVADVRLDAGEEAEAISPHKAKIPYVNFHSDCIARIEQRLNIALVKNSRATYSTADGTQKVCCITSRFHEREKRYWFAFHPHHEQYLSGANNAYVAYGCGNANTLFLIPFRDFHPWLKQFLKTVVDDRFYWHIKIRQKGGEYGITTRPDKRDIDITKYKI